MSEMIIRHETAEDYDAITRLNDTAFGETAQSRIITTLRESGEAMWSKVLLQGGDIIGHLMFYKVLVDGEFIAAGLGPLSVLPDYQKQGFGGHLIRDGLKEADPQRHHLIFLLGHPSYYPRFGFSSELGKQFISPWPRPAFMALKLNPNAPDSGTLTFPQAYL